MIPFYKYRNFTNKIYDDDYLINGIKVMKNYLFPSLESQTCKNFIWVLLLGDKANKTKIKSFLNIHFSFKYCIIYQKLFKIYLKNITKGNDILITTRIDYDDRIYYDAVNDVRKAVNKNKPIILHGYNSGLNYYEFNNKYYLYHRDYRNKGTMSIFASLIIVLDKVNDIYTIYDMGSHQIIRKYLLKKYKSFGIKQLNYEPSNFDRGDVKFVYVRQKYSGTLIGSNKIIKNLKPFNFNLTKFYGK